MILWYLEVQRNLLGEKKIYKCFDEIHYLNIVMCRFLFHFFFHEHTFFNNCVLFFSNYC